ncbi:MAG: SH3 domain-containing protein [Fibrobacter sp.]|nr:SH3 domain-containing protein [Fibrobacter sp.]
MRFVTIAAVITFFSVVCMTSVSNAADTTTTKAEKLQYLLIKEPYASVYKQLDPKSEIVIQAKKGDYLEILGEGQAWYLVKAKESQGWVEKRAGKKVDSKSSPVFPIVLVILLIGATAGGVYYYVTKNKSTEA